MNVHSSYGPTKHNPPIAQPASYNDWLDLMHTLMAYRHEPINSKLMKIRHKYSMLHVDVLILIYHFAKLCSGAVLEIGAFVGAIGFLRLEHMGGTLARCPASSR